MFQKLKVLVKLQERKQMIVVGHHIVSVGSALPLQLDLIGKSTSKDLS